MATLPSRALNEAVSPAPAWIFLSSVLSISESHHSLEDVYLQLVDEDVEAKRR